MPRTPLAVTSLAAILIFLAAAASGSHPRSSSGRSYSSHRSHTYRTPSHHTRRYAYGVPRDSHGRIKRSEAAKRKFERETGYPHGRPGYVVDHIIPSARTEETIQATCSGRR
jgi:hypothetical protein